MSWSLDIRSSTKGVVPPEPPEARVIQSRVDDSALVTPRAERSTAMPRDKPGHQGKRKGAGRVTKYSLFPKRISMPQFTWAGETDLHHSRCCRDKEHTPSPSTSLPPEGQCCQASFFIVNVLWGILFLHSASFFSILKLYCHLYFMGCLCSQVQLKT